ncbi:MAG: isochorismate synthase [Candidatus Humimicrobiaceae bacterium]
MDLKNKQTFKKNIISPLSKSIKEGFLSGKSKEEKFYRYELEINDLAENFDPISWLLLQDEPVKTYWSNRSKNFRSAGIGCADLLSSNLKEYSNEHYFIKDIFEIIKSRLSNTDKNIKYFGCLAFDENDMMDPSWESFGKAYFLVPQVEICTIDNKTIIACNIFYKPSGDKAKKDIFGEIQHFLEKIKPLDSRNGDIKVKFVQRDDNPPKEAWLKNISLAISTFGFEQISKIVLSRKSRFKLKEKISPILLLMLLKKINIETYDYCFQNSENNGFFGCTPELLYSRINNKIYSEALAGTIIRGRNAKEEKEFGEDLLKSKKDSDEYRIVFDYIKNELENLCKSVKLTNKKEILKLSYVQHIVSRFEGNLKPDSDDFKIISSIHPTPAVSGFPKQNIKGLIKRYETFYRGFYAGPVGWIAKDGSEFAVGIRSGIINNNYLSVFSGAGIVKKSSPEAEWNEIENKISPLLKILQNK